MYGSRGAMGLIPAARVGMAAYRRLGGGRRTPASGGGVTAQRDVTSVYRKKKMPRRKRKAWKKFVRKVQAVAAKDRGTVSLVMSYGDIQIHPGWVGGSRQQLVKAIHLFGGNASAVTPLEVGARDLGTISANFQAKGLDDTAKVTFKSGVLDVTVTNPGVFPGASYGGPLEVDVYHVVYGRKNYISNGLINSLDQGTIQTERFDALPKVSINDRGCTPFNLPQGISILGAKILKKKKYFLGAGQSFTYQVRDPKNHIMELVTMQDKASFYSPKYTQSLLVVAKPSNIIEETASFALSFNGTRTYTCTSEGLNQDQSKYYNQFN